MRIRKGALVFASLVTRGPPTVIYTKCLKMNGCLLTNIASRRPQLHLHHSICVITTSTKAIREFRLQLGVLNEIIDRIVYDVHVSILI